jgi:hypothetical protein
MKPLPILLAALAACVTAVSASSGEGPGDAVPVFGIRMPEGYRDWQLISVAREQGKLDDIRAVLGNDIAMDAYRRGTRPFPDGAIIARVAWEYRPLAESEKAFGQHQSWVAGAPKNGVQFMVKNSVKYAATGGWGYAHFDEGRPGSEALHGACHGCHEVVENRDFVFALYAR